MVQKMLEEQPKLETESALSNAVNAKHFYESNGFAPVQLVTGQLLNLPSVIHNKLPAMEEPEEEIVLNHLNAMQAARKAFTQIKF